MSALRAYPPNLEADRNRVMFGVERAQCGLVPDGMVRLLRCGSYAAYEGTKGCVLICLVENRIGQVWRDGQVRWIVGDGHDEDVPASWHGRRVRMVRALVCGNNLALRKCHIALRPDGHNKLFAVGREAVRQAAINKKISTHARFGFDRQNQHSSAAARSQLLF